MPPVITKRLVGTKELFGRKQKEALVPEGVIGGVFFIRVSTTKKDKSKEHLSDDVESQQEKILIFAKEHNIHQIGEFIVETDTLGLALKDRVNLRKAMSLAKENDSYLVTATLDALSKNPEVIGRILAENPKFVTAEYGFKGIPAVMRIVTSAVQKTHEERSSKTKSAMEQIKKQYEIDYQRDLEVLGPDKAIKKRLGIPSVANAPTHISHIRKREALEDAKRCWEAYIRPVIIELSEENDKKPTRAQIAERMNEKVDEKGESWKNKYGNEWTPSILYHMISKLKRDGYDMSIKHEAEPDDESDIRNKSIFDK